MLLNELQIQLKPAGEKPISMFFSKKTEVKSETEILKSSKQDDNLNNVKEELATENTEGKIAEVKNNHVESENCGIKREFEEIETASRPAHENTDTKLVSPALKKGKNVKNSGGDKQASLLSYFGKS